MTKSSAAALAFTDVDLPEPTALPSAAASFADVEVILMSFKLQEVRRFYNQVHWAEESQRAALADEAEPGFKLENVAAHSWQVADTAKQSTQMLDDALTRIDESIFLRAALRTADVATPFVIDSLRFQSDLGLARQYGCTTVRVVSADDIRVSRLVARGQVFDLAHDGAHRSENELDGALCDITLSNTGDLEALADQVRTFLR